MVQWWDPAKIEATVTRQFVCQHLAASDVERLDRSLTFGGDLTDGTYWEWIDTKAKCIFLILVDLKMPSQIFGIIDNSWDDHDLPISQEQVDQLAQTPNRSGRVDRRFFQRQFHYLIKPLQRGDHIVFTNHEVVPLEVIDRRAGLASSHTIDKVVLPNCPGQVFCRRRIPLGNSLGSLTPVDFEEAVNSIRSIQNQHLVSCHASYTHSGAGYVLFTPATDTTLKSFLGNTPSIFKNQSKKDRRQLVMNWILCLVDTLAYIHGRGLSHGNIKLSTILFTSQLDIFYSDFTRLHAEALSGQADKSAFDRESYDYAAPEQWFRPTTGPTSPGGRKATLSMSVSPESHTSFSISRSDNPNNPNSMLQSPNPHLNPQAADIFSLGCVLLEMVSFILKKSTKSFATHRASKNKTAGRGGAVPDSSFHKNLGQVESWMTILAKEASKKTSESDGAAVLRGVVPMLHIIACMLSANPIDRPPADEIQHRVYQILTQNAGITEPHCVHRYGGWDLGFNHLRISSPTPGFEGGLMPHRQNTSASRSSRDSESFSGRRLGHSRTNSSGALSENSQASSSASSDRGGQETELGSSAGSMSVSVSGSGFAALRNIRVPQEE
ncbi:hypothetical protein VDGE_07044 [Verticillium dahliae]|uniref:Protein kinase domain-containing protein n=1 Tax=Verticillium dahliae TaxID=27337 RepID=A0A444S1E3_VERDA|nr:hypothetical protein VDGE_07044 [Verticillium dahliae]